MAQESYSYSLKARNNQFASAVESYKDNYEGKGEQASLNSLAYEASKSFK